MLNGKNLKVISHVETSRFYYKIIFEVVELDAKTLSERVMTINTTFDDVIVLLSSEKSNSTLLINKKIKGFYNNAFYIVKTKDKCNWQKFNAIVDINEFIEDVFSNDKEALNDEIRL